MSVRVDNGWLVEDPAPQDRFVSIHLLDDSPPDAFRATHMLSGVEILWANYTYYGYQAKIVTFSHPAHKENRSMSSELEGPDARAFLHDIIWG